MFYLLIYINFRFNIFLVQVYLFIFLLFEFKILFKRFKFRIKVI